MDSHAPPARPAPAADGDVLDDDVDLDDLGVPHGTPVPTTAPAVVVVVVTHNAGPWFEDMLASLAAQEYPNLSVLVIDAGSASDPVSRVASVLPSAYVRRLEGNPGYGAAANEVLQVVEGATFYALCHDDVLLEPRTILTLVEEALRSNAGVVGPKLVSWGAPEHLLQVGMSADKTGVASSFVERGELDQEQHDGVKDVLFVPGGCMLVRADLFAGLGGFDPDITMLGDDLDLCWRAQLVGARVMVAPDARVEHLEALDTRRRVDDRRRLLARHRLRTMLKCYGPFHLVRVLPQALLFTVIEAVYAVFSGHLSQAADVLGAWAWNIRRLPEVLRERRKVQSLRKVRDTDVRRLQVRGSARLTAFLRGELGGEDRLKALAGAGREMAGSLRSGNLRVALAAWTVLVLLFLIGSRDLLTGPLPAFGSLVPFPDSPFDVLREYVSGWRSAGLGSEAPAPTAYGLLGVAGMVLLGAMGQVQKLLVLGAIPVGWFGAWRMARPLGSVRGRVVAMIVYAAMPLPYEALAQGRLGGLLLYAAAPWVLVRLARATGLPPFSERHDDDRGPVVRRQTARRRERPFGVQALALGVIVAVVAAFVPFAVGLVVVIALAFALSSLVVGGMVGGLRAVGLAIGAVGVAVVLHFPWSLDFLLPGSEWSSVAGVAPLEHDPATWAELLRFQIAPGGPGYGWALLITAALPLLIAKGWRLTWATRAWFVALACWGLAALGPSEWLPVDFPTADVLLAPAAAALALAAALGLVAFETDLPGYRFGWRQLASFVAAAALTVAVSPMLVDAIGGRWDVPTADYGTSLAFFDEAQGDGDFRVLWVGDPTVLPLSGWRLDEGLTYALSDGGMPDARELWSGSSEGATDLVADALELAGSGDTARLGRLLAPLGIRYVIVPERAAPERTGAPRRPVDPGVLRALAAQLDLRLDDLDPALVIYENTAWAPVRAALATDDASAAATGGPLFPTAARTDLAGTEPVLGRRRAYVRWTGDVDRGAVYLAAASSSRWQLTVDGETAERQKGFGWANLFTVDGAGGGTLRFRTPIIDRLVTLIQLLLWVGAIVALRRAASSDVVHA